jgi:hypothetical protein
MTRLESVTATAMGYPALRNLLIFLSGDQEISKAQFRRRIARKATLALAPRHPGGQPSW